MRARSIASGAPGGCGERVRCAPRTAAVRDGREALTHPVLVAADQLPNPRVAELGQGEGSPRAAVVPGPQQYTTTSASRSGTISSARSDSRAGDVHGAGDPALPPALLRADIQDDGRPAGGAVGGEVCGVGLVGELGSEEVQGRDRGLHGVNRRDPLRQTARWTRQTGASPGIRWYVAPRAVDSTSVLDTTDHRVIEHLQRDGRISIADLARAITLSPSATADRVRRLTDAGVITGYSATIDPEALGYPITAFVRLAYPSGNYRPFHSLVETTPEIVEAHHVTGVDCFVIKVIARSMQ